jgi:hypothetical protein
MLFLLYLTIATLTAYKVSGQTAVVAVNPTTSNVNTMQMFTVNVTVSNIANFTSYQFGLYYLNSILNCSGASEGPFLSSGGGTYFGKIINNNYNSTYGRVLVYDTLLGNVFVEGSGVIATITFQAVAGGNTILHLDDIELGDTNIPPQPIPYTSIDGTVQSTGPPPIHDVAITQVTLPKKVLCQGFTVNVTATVTNQGNYPENVNVTFYANATAIGTFTNVPLTIGSSMNLTQVWNATGFAKGNYTIGAYVSLGPGETNTANNNFTDGWIIVSMVGDITGITPFVPDGAVDGRDISTVARSFGTVPGDLWWNANCDIYNDGSVDGRDISVVARHFGQVDP